MAGCVVTGTKAIALLIRLRALSFCNASMHTETVDSPPAYTRCWYPMAPTGGSRYSRTASYAHLSPTCLYFNSSCVLAHTCITARSYRAVPLTSMRIYISERSALFETSIPKNTASRCLMGVFHPSRRPTLFHSRASQIPSRRRP